MFLARIATHWAMLVVFLAAPALASEYPNAKVLDVDKAGSKVQLEIEGKPQWFKLNKARFFNEQGKSISHKSGMGLLASAATLTVSAEPDPHDTDLQIATEVHYTGEKRDNVAKGNTAKTRPAHATGKHPKDPEPLERLDLHPDPNYKGPVADVAVPSDLMRWFPTARVGDFTEYAIDERSWFRYEVVSKEGGAVVLATVGQIESVKTESRVRMTLAAGQKSQAGKEPPHSGKTSQEVVSVNGHDLKCVLRKVGQGTEWYCPEVPLTGVVKLESPGTNKTLVDFGRGK